MTISKWEAHDGLPVARPGGPGRPTRYDLPAIIAWRLVRERAKYEAAAGGLNLDAERAGLAKIQARKTELDVRKREGELAPVADMAAVVTEMLATVRANLLALPSGLAASLDSAAKAGGPRAVEALLRERITGALRELAAWRPLAAPEGGT